ncbi:MAG: diguanylate cyclase [Micromonosporaceae bacterium]
MTVWRARAVAFYGGSLAAVAGVLVAVGTVGTARAWPMIGIVLQLGAVVALGFAIRAGCHRALDHRTRVAWRIVAGAFGVLTLAGVLFAAVADLTVFPNPGDLARIAFAPVMLAGLLAFPVRRTSVRDRYMIKLDVGTVIAAAFMVLWYFMTGPDVSVRRLSTVAGAVALAYPAGDLALITGAALVLLRGTAASLRRPLSLLAAAMVVETVGDAFLGREFAIGVSDPRAAWQAVCWSVGHLLLAAAAFEQCRLAAGHRPARPGRSSQPVSMPPYAAIGVGYGMLLVAALAQPHAYPWTGLVLGIGAITACVLARQVLSLHENRAMAITDGLTGLANRVHLRGALTATLVGARRTGHATAVLLVDMDGFKQVNDVHGHEVGDQLLIAVANLLRRVVSRADMVARLGGDEFAVLLRDVGSGHRAEAVARRIATELAEPLYIGDIRLTPHGSVGVAVSGPGEVAAAELVHRADLAMYVAKRGGTDRWQRYSDGLMHGERDAEALAADLREAVPGGQLRVEYQPIVALPHGQLVGVEALVRWQHPTRGRLSPLEFVPLAERSGLIAQVGDWVLAEACRQVLVWQERLRGPVPLHVNVSASQVDGGYAEHVLDTLRRLGFPPEQLVLELTESTAVHAPAAAHLDALHRAGLKIALDDFGTGYSSLAHLVRLPVDILKIDRSFVAQLGGAPEDSVVAEAILRLSQALRLESVAEGVENLAQATELAVLGCRTAQGFYFARPMTAQAMDTLLDASAGGWPVLPGPAPASPPAAARAGSFDSATAATRR